MIKIYFQLTKPGIIFGNLLTAIGGFALGSKGHFNPFLFLAVMSGLALVIASACVFNNYIDRKADQKMLRTKERALPTEKISPRQALVFAFVLGLAGIIVLGCYTNTLTLLAAVGGMVVYVACYSFWKYHSSTATLVGSIAGAAPPVVGYFAASPHLDGAALLLFLIVALWQMPHFFAIALFRLSDYAAADIPVLPLRRGNYITKVHILFYTAAFLIASLMLTVFGYTGLWYLIVVALLGIGWLWLAFKGLKESEDALWARKMFRFSLAVITLLCFMIAVDTIR